MTKYALSIAGMQAAADTHHEGLTACMFSIASVKKDCDCVSSLWNNASGCATHRVWDGGAHNSRVVVLDFSRGDKRREGPLLRVRSTVSMNMCDNSSYKVPGMTADSGWSNDMWQHSTQRVPCCRVYIKMMFCDSCFQAVSTGTPGLQMYAPSMQLTWVNDPTGGGIAKHLPSETWKSHRERGPGRRPSLGSVHGRPAVQT